MIKSIVSGRRALVAGVAVVLVVMSLFATVQSAKAGPSDALAHVLSQIRGMFSSDFTNLVDWAKNGHPAPNADAVFQPQKTELEILNLDGDDKDAVLDWLQGHGRSALHSQGASDSDIGPAKPGIDAPTATPTPNAWRNVPLATATLDSAAQGKIQILGGFAAAKRDGTSAIACVSFKNIDARVAKHVVFEFPVLSDSGQELGKLVLDRNGEFSPNVDIRSFESMASWQTGGGPARLYGDSCIRKDLPTPALPFLQARAVGYRVMRVDYADGTSWAPGSAAPAQ